jgi:hypothetical protein
MLTIDGIDELKAHAGDDVGVSGRRHPGQVSGSHHRRGATSSCIFCSPYTGDDTDADLTPAAE